MSVIFGVLHMTMGVICKGTNTIYFKDYVSFITEVVFGIIILWGLFGWMDALIITKFFRTPDIDGPCGSDDVIKPKNYIQELEQENFDDS